MKKGYAVIFSMFITGILLLLNPVEAHAESYFWAQDSNGSEASWYKTARPGSEYSVKLDGSPTDLTTGDNITIDCAPDAECSAWLESLQGEIGMFTSFYDCGIRIGNQESDLKISQLNAYQGDIIVYANVYNARTGFGDLSIYGDILSSLRVGDEQSVVGSGNVYVSGDAYFVQWYQKNLRPDFENSNYYVGFGGNLVIGGTVNSGEIFNVLYDPGLGSNGWFQIGEIKSCSAGVFQISDGTLSEQVEVITVQPEFGNYYYQYRCQLHPYASDHSWTKQIYDSITNQLVRMDSCVLEDIPDGASVFIHGVAEDNPIVLDVELEHLEIYLDADRGANVTVNKNVEKMFLMINGTSKSDLVVNGNVDQLNMYYLYNADYNLTVKGKVLNACAISALQSRGYIGWFSCENMQILKDGEWNTNLIMSTSPNKNTAAYRPIKQSVLNEALEENGVGQEYTVSEADKEIILQKSAAVSVEATNDNKLNTVKNTQEMQAVLAQIEQKDSEKELTAKTVCAVDISVDTYYINQEDGNEYVGNDNYKTENVSQLSEGEELSFTVQLPENLYEEGTEYYIVREHKDGSTTIVDELEVVQENNQLTFSSDKYSTFLIVKLTEGKVEEEEPEEDAGVYYRYFCTQGTNSNDGKNEWKKRKYDSATNRVLGIENCSFEDVPADAQIVISGTDERLPVVFNSNLKNLSISTTSSVDVTVKGDVENLSVTDTMKGYRVKVEGKVSTLQLTRQEQEDVYLEVTDKIGRGTLKSYGFENLRYFDGVCGVLIQDGKWNDAVAQKLVEGEDAISFIPIAYEKLEQALAGYGLGTEVTVNNNILLKKIANVYVSQFEEDAIGEKLSDTYIKEAVQKMEEEGSSEMEKLSVIPVCGLDISVSTYYVNTKSGFKYTANSEYTEEVIKELKEGNQLTFTFQIPEMDEEAQYYVLRRHEGFDGMITVDKLPTVIEESNLSFSTDRFSDFIVVKIHVEALNSGGGEGEPGQEAPTPTPEAPTPTPEDPTQEPEESEKEPDVEDNTAESEVVSDVNVPVTGDNSQLLLWLFMLASSFIAVIISRDVYRK